MNGAPVQKDIMKRMDATAEAFVLDGQTSEPIADTRFEGTREEPSLRGKITDISLENLTVGGLSFAFMKGMCRELYDYYRRIPEQYRKDRILTGGGNGIRNSRIQRDIIEEMFDCELVIPENSEEAACGAAKCVQMILNRQ